jgi:UDP-N-acetylglucosamine--N-acetylmuramyl-(pentapeptide) pyrophosphoryl-undecaprenol N-acetylglucosamine transferase
LYPGLAIARALVQRESQFAPFFIGAQRGIEREVLPATEFPHALLDLHPLYRRTPWNNWRTVVGAVRAWRALTRLSKAGMPEAVVGTGGYAAGVALAWARMHGVPTVLHEPDSHPGLTTRAFSKGARAIFLGFAEAQRQLTVGDTTMVRALGAPIVPPQASPLSRPEARAKWQLPADAFVVLVVGGSQGARAINNVVAAWCEQGLPDGVALIWATGKSHFSDYERYESTSVRVRAYLSPIADAYAAADVAVARAGAMSIAELCAWGVPPILIPLPTAAQDHQTYNAKSVADVGAAINLPQSELTVKSLQEAVTALRDDPLHLERMRAAARERAHPNAAADIAEALSSLLGL